MSVTEYKLGYIIGDVTKPHTWGMEKLCYLVSLSATPFPSLPFTSYVRKGDRLKIQRRALRVFDDMTKWCQARWVHIHGLYDLYRVSLHYHRLVSEFLSIFNINLIKFSQINVKEESFHQTSRKIV